MRGDVRNQDLSPSGRLVPLLGIILILAWTIFFLLTRFADDNGRVAASALLAEWAVPVLLVIGIWLLVLRYREAAIPRGRARRAGGNEGDALADLSRALSLQVDRAAALNDRLAETIGGAGQAPEDNGQLAETRLEHLRMHSERFQVELESREQDNLAAIRRRADELAKSLSAQDIALRRDATQAMDELQARFKAAREDSLRLSGELEKIQADALRGWERAVADLEARMRETVGKVVEVDEAALQNTSARLAALQAEAERIDSDASARLQAFDAEVARRRDEAMAGAAASLSGLEEDLAAFDARMGERREAQLARVTELGRRSEELAARMAEIDGTLAGHVEQFEHASAALASFTGDLTGRLAESRDLLERSGAVMGEMGDASTRLFEQVRASADYSSRTIPAALDDAQGRLAAFEERAKALREAIGAAEERGAALAAHLDKAREGVPVSREALDALGERLEALAAKSDALARHTRQGLADAIAELETSTEAMAQRLREGQEAALRDFAATFGQRSMEAIGDGLRAETEAAIAALERSSQDAGKSGLATIAQLREGLGQIDEMTGNLEARVAEARKQAQDEPTRDFSIEMTKITEKLNGAAVDITKIFDADVPDTAWQAYMRGDYGVFTRKAVRLISSQKAEAIFARYREDQELRETINRYVHDFESMLRVVLATRNGHQMAVTLLSSDIGKLYVALAQATERLRD